MLQGLCAHLVSYYPLREIVQALVNAVIVEGVADPVIMSEQFVGCKSEADRWALSSQARQESDEAPLWARAALALKRTLAELPDVGGRLDSGD
jgi:hypothetical protein